MKKALQGVRVLDFTQALAGVYCAMYLGDFGADVIKVEPNTCGDQSREWGPFVNGESVYFATYNRNKRSIALDLVSPEGKQIVMDLVKDCDVVLSNFKYGTMEKLGFGYEDLKNVNPQVIYGEITGFGTNGPLRDKPYTSITAAARGGLIDKIGEADGPPIKPGFPIGDNWSGLNLLMGISMALVNKQTTGQGCYLDLGMMDAVMYLQDQAVLEYIITNHIGPRSGNHDIDVAPYGAFKAKDGWAVIGCMSEGHWKKFCNLMNLTELADDERFSTNELRVANLKELVPEIEKGTSIMNKMEIETLLQSNRIPAGAVMSMPELIEDEYVKVRELAPEVDHPVIGKFRTMGIPMKFNKTPGDCSMRPAPALGEHSDEVLKEIGYTEEKIAELRSRGVISSKN
ncbi:MAG: CaiB/BaiF CoA transferase family protein [Candidatus Saccharibacteria bacterium]